MDRDSLSSVHVRLKNDDDQQALIDAHDRIVEEDRWNDELSAAETMRRVIRDYGQRLDDQQRVLQEKQQMEQAYNGLLAFLKNNGHEEALQAYMQAMEESVQAHEQKSAEDSPLADIDI